jgi:superfamily I DNA and/or RNA helicase
MIIDEAGIERLEHLLWPLQYGINQMVPHLGPEDIAERVHGLIDLITECGVTATIVGDPKQSRPISPVSNDYSAIEWVSKRTSTDTLFTTHRLPDQLAGLVNDFAEYGGLKSADDIAARRLVLRENPNPLLSDILAPADVVTWVDTNGEEEPSREFSWANDIEAKACAKLCTELKRITRNNSVAVVTRFVGQRGLIQGYLKRLGFQDIKVQTTTSALGTQADVVIFSLVRNNEERNVGAAGTLEDLNVAISRAKEKLIILGNFEMMSNGWSPMPTLVSRGRRSPARRLAHLIERGRGRIIYGSTLANTH